MSGNTQMKEADPGEDRASRGRLGCLEWLYKNALLILIVLIVGA